MCLRFSAFTRNQAPCLASLGPENTIVWLRILKAKRKMRKIMEKQEIKEQEKEERERMKMYQKKKDEDEKGMWGKGDKEAGIEEGVK
jgi:hypothetical protein